MPFSVKQSPEAKSHLIAAFVLNPTVKRAKSRGNGKREPLGTPQRAFDESGGVEEGSLGGRRAEVHHGIGISGAKVGPAWRIYQPMRHPKQPQKAAKEEDPEKVEWEEQAIEMESSTKHGHGAQKTFRLERVARMLVEGKSRAQICAILGENWGRAPRTIQNYIGDAWRLLAKRAQQSAAMQRGKNLARLDMTFRMAVAAGNLGSYAGHDQGNERPAGTERN